MVLIRGHSNQQRPAELPDVLALDGNMLVTRLVLDQGLGFDDRSESVAYPRKVSHTRHVHVQHSKECQPTVRLSNAYVVQVKVQGQWRLSLPLFRQQQS